MFAEQGLSTKEARRRLVRYGENVIQSKGDIHPFRILVSQFRDLLTLILLGATVCSALMGEVVEAFTMIAIVFVNALLGFFQEYRTERSLEKLSRLSAPAAQVLRDGVFVSLPARELVPGDVIRFEAGGRIPADCRLTECHGLSCDESMLSGEALPVEKAVSDGEGPCLAFMGTMAVSGRGQGVVTATGPDTEMGRIAGMLRSIRPEPTPLQKNLDQMSRYIAAGCLIVCVVVSLMGILRGEPVLQMVLTGISLSVAAIPEGLAAIVTISLALSVNRMVKRQAVIRRLHAVETLGCATVICSDKTGTLTQNQMTVTTVATCDHTFSVSGTGTSPGMVTLGGRRVSPAGSPALEQLLRIGVLCSNAQLCCAPSRRKGDGEPYAVTGGPTESALVILAAKAGIFRETCGFRVLREIPFDSTRKRMSVVVQQSSGQLWLFTKGGFDIILERCTMCACQDGTHPMTPAMRQELTRRSNEMARQALRVLGFCCRKLSTPEDTQESNMIFAGFAGMIDPPRPEAAEAVLQCQRAGIRPVMITGDNQLTACAIAQKLHILHPSDRVISGEELEKLSEEELLLCLPQTAVFARVTPAHKLRIVRGLKKLGHVVAMTGDGINDAPAVKEANIGVSMGISGTDVTREASSVILMDDNFATLVAAVEEGRVIYRNIRKFIRYLLSSNTGEVMTMVMTMVMGMPIPLLPIHILLVNLVTDGLPAVALGLEPPEEDVMHCPPRRPGESIFSGGLLGTILFRGCLIGLTATAVFSAFLQHTRSLPTAQTAALVTLSMAQLIHVFECKSERRSLFSMDLTNNPHLLAAVFLSAAVLAAAVYHPAACAVFCTVPLGGKALAFIGASLMAAPVLSAVISGLSAHSPKKQAPPTAKRLPDALQ